MLLSLALVFLCGSVLGAIMQKLRLPSLLGMLITGIVLGPQMLNLLDPKLLSISAELRQIALVIILLRAGLNLDLKALRKVGRPAVLLCFVPASFEIVGMLLLAPLLLGFSYLEAAILGTVIAAVSPAVVVPGMLLLHEGGYGVQKGIPQMLMAGAAVDDVFVIVLFTALTALAQGGKLTAAHFLLIPSSILFGLLLGVLLGLVLSLFFARVHIRDSSKVVLILALAFLLLSLEQSLSGGVLGFSALLAVMALGGTVQQRQTVRAQRLATKFAKLWVGAELLLFALVGATVNLSCASKVGGAALLLLALVMLFRMAGVLLCLVKTDLNRKERLFAALAYMPKATVQAAIGGLPLALGLACGEVVLAVAVLAILLTAPLGATLIERSHKQLLAK